MRAPAMCAECNFKSCSCRLPCRQTFACGEKLGKADSIKIFLLVRPPDLCCMFYNEHRQACKCVQNWTDIHHQPYPWCSFAMQQDVWGVSVKPMRVCCEGPWWWWIFVYNTFVDMYLHMSGWAKPREVQGWPWWVASRSLSFSTASLAGPCWASPVAKGYIMGCIPGSSSSPSSFWISLWWLTTMNIWGPNRSFSVSI